MPIQAMYLGKLAHGKSTIEKIAVDDSLDDFCKNPHPLVGLVLSTYLVI